MRISIAHLYGILWFIAHLLISSTNDVLMKYLGLSLGVYQVVFLRFFFSTLTLLPFFLYKKATFSTTRPLLHIVRGVLLFSGITLWCIGLTSGKVALATTINFTMPIFVLLLARIFLQESVTKFKLIATCLGLVGVVVALNPLSEVFNPYSLFLLVSAFIFATLDIVNKKFITKEPMINMIFYSSLVTMLCSIPPAIWQWQAVTIPTLLIFLILGIGANLILYCLLKSFAALLFPLTFSQSQCLP